MNLLTFKKELDCFIAECNLCGSEEVYLTIRGLDTSINYPFSCFFYMGKAEVNGQFKDKIFFEADALFSKILCMGEK